MLTDHKNKTKQSRGFIFIAQTHISGPTGKLNTLPTACIVIRRFNSHHTLHPATPRSRLKRDLAALGRFTGRAGS